MSTAATRLLAPAVALVFACHPAESPAGAASRETGETGESADADCARPGVWYADGDGDGHGAPTTATKGCEGDGRVAVGDDCDDDDPNRHPGAPELCDRHDNNCDGAWTADDEVGLVTFFDAEGRGHDRTGEWAGSGVFPAHPVLDAGTWHVCPGGFNISATTAGPVALRGAGPEQTVLSGGGEERILESGYPLTISGLSFVAGRTPYDGAAVKHTSGALVIEDTLFGGNSASDEGGALYSVTDDGSGVTLRRVTFSSNDAYAGGGALIEATGDVSIEDCTFDHNNAHEAAGLGVEGASVRVTASSFVENAAEASYGGAWLTTNGAGGATVENSRFERNQAGAHTGGLEVSTGGGSGGTLTVGATTFVGNIAREGAGGASLGGATVTVSDVVVARNVGATAGLSVSAKRLTMADCRFTDNRNNGQAGGLAISVYETCDLDHLSFTANRGAQGGGLYLGGPVVGAHASVSNSTFEDNVALDGGGAALGDVVVAITATTFRHNTAVRDGGGLFASGAGALGLGPGTVLRANRAGGDGGGLHAHHSTVCRGTDALPTSFYRNVGHRGGAVYFWSQGAAPLHAYGCDFGVGANDNRAGEGSDLYVEGGGAFTYGEAATFACLDTRCD